MTGLTASRTKRATAFEVLGCSANRLLGFSVNDQVPRMQPLSQQRGSLSAPPLWRNRRYDRTHRGTRRAHAQEARDPGAVAPGGFGRRCRGLLVWPALPPRLVRLAWRVPLLRR